MKKLLLLLLLMPSLVMAESIKDYFDNNHKWSADTKEIIYLTTRCSGILQVVGQHRIVVGDKEKGSVLLEDGRNLRLQSDQLALDSDLSIENIKARMAFWMKKYAEDSIYNTDYYNNIFVGDFADDFSICYQLTSVNLKNSGQKDLKAKIDTILAKINHKEEEIIASKNIQIVIAPFETEGFVASEDIGEIIINNLNKSGRFSASNTDALVTNQIDFNFWKEHKKDAVVFGKVEQVSTNVYDVYVYIYDVFSKQSLYQKKIRVSKSGLRKIAHYLSDKVYEVILNEKGSFNTRLSFVKVQDNSSSDGRTYRLQISDSDYHNAQTVVRASTLIDSLSFSPDGQKLAYVSNKNATLEVFVVTPFIKSFPLRLPKFDDNIALAPSWHPDGKSILYTISKFGIQNIYNYSFENKKLQRSISSPGIDIGASYSPDGKNIVFTSNRLTYKDNSPKAITDRKIEDKAQIFIKNLDTGRVIQVPIGGDYNAGAVYSPDGTKLALIHGYGAKRTLVVYDLDSKQLEVIDSSNNINTGVFFPKLSFSSNGESLFYQYFKNNINYLSEVNLNNYKSNQIALGPNANNDPILSIYEILDKGFLSPEDLKEYSDDALIEMAKAMRLDFKFKYNSDDNITNRNELILALSFNSYTFDTAKNKPKTAEEILEQSNEKFGIISLEEAEERLKIAELEAKEAEEKVKLAEQEALKEKAKKVFAEVKKKAEENSSLSQPNESEKQAEAAISEDLELNSDQTP